MGKVNAAIDTARDAIESGLYTGASVTDLQASIDAVVWDKTVAGQGQIDAMADAILDATGSLIEKALEIILNISEGMVAEAHTISPGMPHITAGSSTSFAIINDQIKILSCGVYYAAGEEALNAYLAGDLSTQAVLWEFDSGADNWITTRITASG